MIQAKGPFLGWPSKYRVGPVVELKSGSATFYNSLQRISSLFFHLVSSSIRDFLHSTIPLSHAATTTDTTTDILFLPTRNETPTTLDIITYHTNDFQDLL